MKRILYLGKYLFWEDNRKKNQSHSIVFFFHQHVFSFIRFKNILYMLKIY